MGCTVHKILHGHTPTPVSVNGVVIPRDAIAREAQYHPADKPFAAWQSAALALVVRELLLQRACALEISPVPLSDSRGRRETEEEALIRAVIETEVITPEPDEETCRRYYESNRHRFRSPTIWEASHILFAAGKDDAEGYATARRRAVDLIAELKQHPERFGDLARENSICKSAAQGGKLGQITTGQTTPEFEEALRQLAPGSIGEAPVETRFGLHIIRLDRTIPGVELPYEHVAGRIADYLQESVKCTAMAEYIALLVSSAEITGLILPGAEAYRVH